MIEGHTVIDAHFHHVPLLVFQKLDAAILDDVEARSLQAKSRDDRYMSSRASMLLRDLDTTFRFMDEVGTDIAMLQMPSWSVAGLEICRFLNDGLAQTWRAEPKRVLPVATVPYVHGQASLDELTRIREELGFRGVSILTSHGSMRLDDASLRPFFKKAAALGLVVLVHPPTQAKGLWGGAAWNIGASLSRQYDNAKCFAEVLHGVLPEIERLQFLFSHLGGGIPFLLGRIKSWYRPPPQAGIDVTDVEYPITSWEFDELGLSPYFESLLDRCWFDVAGTGGVPSQAVNAMSVLRSDRIVFGTDYPHEMSRVADAKAYLQGIFDLVPETARRRGLLSENLHSLFEAN